MNSSLKPATSRWPSVEVALGVAGVNLVADLGAGKVAREEIVGGGDVLDCQRDVIEIRQPVGRRLWMRLLPIRGVPELDQRAERRARRDEGGRRARIVLLLVDNAHSARLQIGDERVEAVRLDRQMMHPLAMPLDELRYEAGLAGRILDQFDDEAAEMEILPVERPADLLVERLGAAQLDRKVLREKLVGAVDGLHRDRNMIEPQANIVSSSHAETNLPSTKCARYFAARPGRKRHSSRNELRITSGHPLATFPAYMRSD